MEFELEQGRKKAPAMRLGLYELRKHGDPCSHLYYFEETPESYLSRRCKGY